MFNLVDMMKFSKSMNITGWADNYLKNRYIYYTGGSLRTNDCTIPFFISFILLFVCDFCHLYLCFVTKWFKHVKIQILIVQKLGHVTHQKFKICKIID